MRENLFFGEKCLRISSFNFENKITAAGTKKSGLNKTSGYVDRSINVIIANPNYLCEAARQSSKHGELTILVKCPSGSFLAETSVRSPRLIYFLY